MSIYFSVSFRQVLFPIAKVLCGGPSGAQCNSTGCYVFPVLWSAAQPEKCPSDSPLLTAFCTHSGCTPWFFALASNDLTLLLWLLCNQPGSLFSFILMSHLLITVNDDVQLQFSLILAAASWDFALSSLVSAPCRWWSREEMSCYSWNCTTLKRCLFVFPTTGRIGLGGQTWSVEEKSFF